MHEQTQESVRMCVFTRLLTTLALALSAAAHIRATTLEQLTLDEMTQQSTAIVRARVTGSHSAYRGTSIYTTFQLQVLETWKGQAIGEVAVPGGVVGGIRQSVAGAPDLRAGQEYVLFLWTSRSGLTQVIGLSQGVFSVSGASNGALAQRPAAGELMLDQSGLPAEDRAVSMQVQDLRTRVLRALGASE
jgi:hypothetical protein